MPGEPNSKRTNTTEQSWSRGTGSRSATGRGGKKSAFYETRKFSIMFTTAGPLNSVLKKPHSPIVFVADSYYIPINTYSFQAASSFRFPTNILYPFLMDSQPASFPTICHNLKCTNYEAPPCAVFLNFLFVLLRASKYFSQRTALTLLESSICNTNRTAPSRVRFDLHATNQTLVFTGIQLARHSQVLFDFAGVKYI